MKQYILLNVLLFSTCFSAPGQQHWTLYACIRQAQDSQFLARNAVLNMQMAASEKREAGRALLPAVKLNAANDLSGSRFANAATADVNLSLPLYQGGYLRSQLRYRAALEAYAAGMQRRTLAGIKWTVVTLFTEALLARDNYQAARSLYSLLYNRTARGLTVRDTYLLRKYENLQTFQEQQYRKASQELMEYIYQPVNAADSLVAVYKIQPEYSNSDTAIANGLLTDAGLKADRLGLAAAMAQVQYKNRAAWPALAVNAYYGPSWESHRFFRYPGGDFSSGLSLRVVTPLFNMGSIRKDKEQAGISVSQAALRLQEDTRLLYQDMLQYYARHRLSVQNLEQAEAAEQAAAHLLENAVDHYVGLNDLLLATDQWYTAALAKNSAKYLLVYQTLWIDFNSGKL